MTFLSFLKKKDPPIRLSVNNVNDWLESYLESVGLSEDLTLLNREISIKKQKIKSLLTVLVNTKIPLAVPHFTQKMILKKRDVFIEDSLSIFKNISFPKKLVDSLSFIQDLISIFDSKYSSLQKNIFSLREHFTSVDDINKKFVEFEKIIVNFRVLLEKKNFQNVLDAKKEVDNFFFSKERVSVIELEISKKEKLKKIPLEKLSKVNKKISEFEGHRDFISLNKLQESLDGIDIKFKEVSNDFNSFFENISPELKFLVKSGDDRSKLIDDYLSKPIDTFLSDKILVLHSIVKELEKKFKKSSNSKKNFNLSKEKIDLFNSSAKICSKKWLSLQQSKLSDVFNEKKDAEFSLKRNHIYLMLSEQRKYLKLIHEELSRIKNDLSKLENEKDSLSLRLLLQKVRDSLLKLNPNIIIEELK